MPLSRIMAEKVLFVTVGTTKFDLLVKSICDKKCLKLLVEQGFTKISLQIGNGDFEPQPSDLIDVSFYRLKKSIKSDIQAADLVVSHAGAGSCLEVLESQKPLIVVVNEDLMDNHQTELAQKFYDEGYLYYCTCKTLGQTLTKNLQKLKPYKPGNPHLFAEYLNKVVGLAE